MALSRSFVGSATQSGGTTAALGVNVAIGAADAERIVVAAMRMSTTGSPTTLAFTIGGVAASVRTIRSTICIIWAKVPTGTTADIVCTAMGGSSPTVTQLRAMVYRIVGPVSVHDSVATTGLGSTLSIGLGETAGGATIAMAQATGNVTWTYPAEDAEVTTGTSAASSSPGSAGSVTVQASGSLISGIGAVHFREPIVDVTAALSGKLRLSARMYETLPTATLSAKLRLGFSGSAAAGADGRLNGKLRLGFAGGASISFPEDYFKRLINSPKHGDPIVYLLTITHPALEEPARLALSRDGHDMTSNGAPYRAVYFEVEPVADLERGTASAKVRAPNVNRQIGTLLDEQDEPAVVRIDLVTFATPDIIRKTWKRLRLRNARWDASMVEVEVAQKDFSRIPGSAIAATPAYCRALFK